MTSVVVPMWSRVGILHTGHITDPPVIWLTWSRVEKGPSRYLSQIILCHFFGSSNITTFPVNMWNGLTSKILASEKRAKKKLFYFVCVRFTSFTFLLREHRTLALSYEYKLNKLILQTGRRSFYLNSYRRNQP